MGQFRERSSALPNNSVSRKWKGNLRVAFDYDHQQPLLLKCIKIVKDNIIIRRSSRLDTAVWMHYLDANKTAGEEARRQVHENVASDIEQVLAATPHEAPTIRPPASYHETVQVRLTRHVGHCWRSRDELISNVLLWTSIYDQAKAVRPARTYIQQLCENTGCSPEDLLEVMNDREKWQEKVRDILACGTTWWW